MTNLLEQTGRNILAALNGYRPRRISPENGTVRAAVLIPLLERDGAVKVLFTKRTSNLPHHAGQISFPGGAREDKDPDSLATALRETREEVGIEPDKVEVVTRLDQIVTITNFLVTPYLGLVSPEARLTINPVEVARLVEVPAKKVFDPASYHPTEVSWQGTTLMNQALSHNGDVIWGATARILLNLLEALGPAAGGICPPDGGEDRGSRAPV